MLSCKWRVNENGVNLGTLVCNKVVELLQVVGVVLSCFGSDVVLFIAVNRMSLYAIFHLKRLPKGTGCSLLGSQQEVELHLVHINFDLQLNLVFEEGCYFKATKVGILVEGHHHD